MEVVCLKVKTEETLLVPETRLFCGAQSTERTTTISSTRSHIHFPETEARTLEWPETDLMVQSAHPELPQNHSSPPHLEEAEELLMIKVQSGQTSHIPRSGQDYNSERLKALNQFLQETTSSGNRPVNYKSLWQQMWTSSVDFKDAYFYIPTHKSSRNTSESVTKAKCINSRPYPLAYGYSSPMDFHKGSEGKKIMIHHFLDDWLSRDMFKQTLLNQT